MEKQKKEIRKLEKFGFVDATPFWHSVVEELKITMDVIMEDVKLWFAWK